MDPEQRRVGSPGQPRQLFRAIVVLAHLQKLLGVVGNHPVNLVADAPPHHVLIVDRPDEDRSMGGFGVLQERLARGTDENLLQQVERHIRRFEELSGVAQIEANVGDGETGQIAIAEREVAGLGPSVLESRAE